MCCYENLFTYKIKKQIRSLVSFIYKYSFKYFTSKQYRLIEVCQYITHCMNIRIHINEKHSFNCVITMFANYKNHNPLSYFIDI